MDLGDDLIADHLGLFFWGQHFKTG
jgi:hypothetical protein